MVSKNKFKVSVQMIGYPNCGMFNNLQGVQNFVKLLIMNFFAYFGFEIHVIQKLHVQNLKKLNQIPL